MRRMPVPGRLAAFLTRRCLPARVRGIRPYFSGLSRGPGWVAYVLLTRAPVASTSTRRWRPAAPRLACVKPVASVHPEPGSNSPLFIFSFFFFLCLLETRKNLFSAVLHSVFSPHCGDLGKACIGFNVLELTFVSFLVLLSSVALFQTSN